YFHDHSVTGIQTGYPERALDCFVNGSLVDHCRAVRFHSSIVVRIDRSWIGGIDESAIYHVIGVVSESVVGSGVSVPGASEIDRAALRTRAAAGLDDHFERNDLSERHGYVAD